MAESDEEYDPNEGVAPWVNIVVPIATVVVFLLAVVALYVTKYEIPVKTIEKFVEKIPLVNRILIDDNDDKDNLTNASTSGEPTKEVKLTKSGQDSSSKGPLPNSDGGHSKGSQSQIRIHREVNRNGQSNPAFDGDVTITVICTPDGASHPAGLKEEPQLADSQSHPGASFSTRL